MGYCRYFLACLLLRNLPFATAAVAPKPNLLVLPTNNVSASLPNASLPQNNSFAFDPPPPEPYVRPIAFDSRSVTFTNYGRPIYLGFTTDVTEQANEWMRRNLQTHRLHDIVPPQSVDYPRGPRWRSHRSIKLVIRPGPRMTWKDAGTIMMAIYQFIGQYGGFEFEVELSDHAGLIGSADMKYIQYPPPLLGDLVANKTWSGVGNLTNLPPDPSSFEVPNTGMTIVLRDIGKPIPGVDVGSCILQALFDIINMLIRRGGDTYIGRDLSWNWQHASLHVFPSRRMTYGDLSIAIKGILSILNAYGYWVFIRMEFFQKGEGSIGVATLTYQ